MLLEISPHRLRENIFFRKLYLYSLRFVACFYYLGLCSALATAQLLSSAMAGTGYFYLSVFRISA